MNRDAKDLLTEPVGLMTQHDLSHHLAEHHGKTTATFTRLEMVAEHRRRHRLGVDHSHERMVRPVEEDA